MVKQERGRGRGERERKATKMRMQVFMFRYEGGLGTDVVGFFRKRCVEGMKVLKKNVKVIKVC